MESTMGTTLTQEKLSEQIRSANSWGDMIRSIEQEKRKDLNMSEFVPTKRVTMFEKKRLERIVDPVAMKFRDPQLEQDYQDRKTKAIQQRAENAKLELSKKFDIVSHQGPPRKIDVEPPRLMRAPSRPYHLLSNMKKPDHELAPLIFNEAYGQEKTKRTPRVLNFTAPNRRDFDVISNNYYFDNDVKQAKDKEDIREHVNTVYWKTHDLDIIKGQFYSDDKEEEFQLQRQLAASVQGLSQQYRLPPSIKYSEGNSYNILQQTVTDEGRMRVTAKLNTGHISHASEIQAKQREAGIARMELENQRRLNRPDFKRWQSEIDRSFGLIDNLPKESFLPHPVRPVTVWTRLQESNNSQPQGRLMTSAGVPRSAGHTPFSKLPVSGIDSGFGETTAPRNLSEGAAGELNSLASPINASVPKISEPQVRSSGTAGQSKPSSFSKPPSARISATANTTSSRLIPSLNLTLAEPPEPVAYAEIPGPPGLAIPIVRTGGINNY